MAIGILLRRRVMGGSNEYCDGHLVGVHIAGCPRHNWVTNCFSFARCCPMATFGTRHKTRRFGTISRKSSFSFVNGKNDSCDGFLFLLNMFIKRCTYIRLAVFHLRPKRAAHRHGGLDEPKFSPSLWHQAPAGQRAHGLAGLPTRDPWLLSVLLPVRRVSYWRPIKKPIMPKVADAASAVDLFRMSDSKKLRCFRSGMGHRFGPYRTMQKLRRRAAESEWMQTQASTVSQPFGPQFDLPVHSLMRWIQQSCGKNVACQSCPPSVTFCRKLTPNP